jgi:hypothetical protein
MKLKHSIKIVLLFLISSCAKEDAPTAETIIYPSYGAEMQVTINGLSFDAMEPFLSADGNYLFFNSLNDGEETKLYYASKLTDSSFNLMGELTGANQASSPQLDAVADMDADGNFYWTSTRNYPAELNNLFYGSFIDGNITNISRVQGDFNMNTPGWLVMDHGISLDGQFLYFNNARFDAANCPGPCETTLGIAQKNTDGSFSTLANSDSILENIIDDNYIYYAPCISSDNLELYYTRFLKGPITAALELEICVAVRTNSTAQFSIPKVLFSETIADLIEAPTLSVDKNIMYYHKKTAGTHKIMMRFRN